MKKIAIIGCSIGQKVLYEKAKDLGLTIYAFAYEKGAMWKDLADYFYPISVTDTDAIIEVLKRENITAIVSNASNLTAKSCSEISTKLSLIGNNYSDFVKCENKYYVRTITSAIEDVYNPNYCELNDFNSNDIKFPFIIKPKEGGGKIGVSLINNMSELDSYMQDVQNQKEYIIEEYIDGSEISIESLSYNGKHMVIQVTDKVNSGGPHFTEIEHHQPSKQPHDIIERIKRVIPQILTVMNFKNGISHIEMRIVNNKLYLIEVNQRGGGCNISSDLVYLSTGFDYIKALIDVATGKFQFPENIDMYAHKSGVVYLCGQNRDLLPKFLNMENIPYFVKGTWHIKPVTDKNEIKESIGNFDRAAYYIYQK